MNNQPSQVEPPVLQNALIIKPQSTLVTPESLPTNAIVNSHQVIQSTDGIHLREYWRIVKRRQKLVWLVIILGAMVGTLYSFQTKSIYTAKAIIEVASEQPTLLKGSDGYGIRLNLD